MALSNPVRPLAECDCIWCGRAARAWMELSDWRRPGVPDLHRLYWCDHCRFGQIAPRPTPPQVASYYEVQRYYTHYTHAEGAPVSAPGSSWLDRLRVHLAWRADRSDELAPQRVLDLARQGIAAESPAVCDMGCGNGTLMAALRDRGCTVVGIEPDPAARCVAVGRGLQVIDGAADARTLPAGLPAGSFDTVVISHVLEHCIDPRQSLINARLLLRPGGNLLCEVPNNEAIGLAWSLAAWRWLDVPRHLNFFTARSLKRACELAGYSTISISYTGYLRQFTNDWLNDERQIAESLRRNGRIGAAGHLMPMTSARSWAMLARSAFARKAGKYDSVWTHAINE